MKYLAEVGRKWERKMHKEDKLWKNRKAEKKAHQEIPDENKQGDITNDHKDKFQKNKLANNKKN